MTSPNKGKKLQKDFPDFRKRVKEIRNNPEYREKFDSVVSRSTYESWINGKTEYTGDGNKRETIYKTPSLDNLIRISDACGLSIDYILGRSDFIKADNQLISDYTGLSEKAIENLHHEKERPKSEGERSLCGINAVLGYVYMNLLDTGFDWYINSKNAVPVHFDDDGKAYVPHGINMGSYTSYPLYLAKDPNDLTNIFPVRLSPAIVQSMALTIIQKCLNDTLNSYDIY